MIQDGFFMLVLNKEARLVDSDTASKFDKIVKLYITARVPLS